MQEWGDQEGLNQTVRKVLIRLEDPESKGYETTEPFPRLAPPEDQQKHEERKKAILTVTPLGASHGNIVAQICMYYTDRT